MPKYLGKDISDDDMQALISAYRDGQKEAGGEDAVEDSDQVVIDHLTKFEVLSPRAPSAFDLGKGTV